jgi:hypothetical protein
MAEPSNHVIALKPSNVQRPPPFISKEDGRAGVS